MITRSSWRIFCNLILQNWIIAKMDQHKWKQNFYFTLLSHVRLLSHHRLTCLYLIDLCGSTLMDQHKWRPVNQKSLLICKNRNYGGMIMAMLHYDIMSRTAQIPWCYPRHQHCIWMTVLGEQCWTMTVYVLAQWHIPNFGTVCRLTHTVHAAVQAFKMNCVCD